MNEETPAHPYGKNCPDDWVRAQPVQPLPAGGVTLLADHQCLAACFGCLAMTVWASA